MQDEEEKEGEEKEGDEVMGPFGGAALKRCLILVGSGVASLLLASTVADAFSHRLECRGRLAGNLNVCENALFFVRSAAVALCPKRCDIDDDRVVIVPFTPPCEASPLTTAGAPAVAMEATAGTTYGPSSFLQRTLSRFLTRDRDVTPSGSTAQNIGYRRVVAVMVTAGAIAVGLLLPYLIVARINGKKRRRGGNESSEGDKETCGVDRRWYACCLGQSLLLAILKLNAFNIPSSLICIGRYARL